MNLELKVGLLVLIAVAALAYMTTLLTHESALSGKTKIYYLPLETAIGLTLNSKIKIAGLNVGKVGHMELRNNRAFLTLHITADTRVHSDARASVKTLGYLGDKYISLSPGSDESPLLPEYSKIVEKHAGASLDDLTDKSSQILAELEAASHSIHFAAREIEAIVSGIKRGHGTIGKLVTEEDTYDRINTTLSGVDRVMTDINQIGISLGMQGAYLPGTASGRGDVNLEVRPGLRPFFILGATTRPQGPVSGTHLNAQFGYSLGAIRFRGGVFENELGLGSDARIGNSTLVYAELYRLQGPDSPQLNLGLKYEFYRPFFSWLGADYLNISRNRSATLGLGAMFDLLGR